MNKKLFIPFILFLAIVLAFVVQLSRNAQGDDPKALESSLVGQPVPITQAFDLFNNQQYDLHLFQQGKPLLLNVWATWCPTCYAEHQYLNQLASQGITIIGLNYKDENNKAINWLAQLNNPYQVVLKDKTGKLGFDLGVYGAPETFLVDRHGIIHYRYAGNLTAQVWQDKIKPLYEQLLHEKE
ncbi:MAG: DsbE family thiol:disulfide interchange protein [Pasteurellaceae bacterium]|nr:DsbE family thiol:disulfide interchange protein [Pasteurellaceae bacterium]